MTGLSTRDARFLALFAQESMRAGIHKALLNFIAVNAPPSPPRKARKTPKVNLYPDLPDEDYTRNFNVAIEVKYGLRRTLVKDGFLQPAENMDLVSLHTKMLNNSPAPLDPMSEPESSFVSAVVRRWGIPLNSQRVIRVKPIVEVVADQNRSAANEKKYQETAHACLSVVNNGERCMSVRMPLLISDPSPYRLPISHHSSLHGNVHPAKPLWPLTLPLKVVYQLGRIEHSFYIAGASFSNDEYGGNVCGCCHMCGFTTEDGIVSTVPIHIRPHCAIHSHLFV